MKNIILSTIILYVFANELQAQWVKQTTHTGVSLWETKFISPDIGYAIGWTNSTSTFLKTHDGGKTWAKTDMPNTYMFSVQFLDSLKGYIAGYDFGCSCGYIRKTTDGGNNWTDTKLSETFGLYRIIMKDMNNGWAAGYQGRILTTNNGWTTHDSGSTGTGSIIFRELCKANNDTLYAGGGPDFATQNQVYRSINGGKTWVKIQDLTGKFSISGLYFLNGKTGFMTGNNGVDVIMKTTDASQTWTPKYTGKNSADLVDDINFSSVMGYAVTSSGKILKSFDKGETWVSESSPVSNSLYAVNMVNDYTGYAAGESGTMIKRVTSPGIAEPELINTVNLDIYPNPFFANTTISFETRNAGPIEIKLFDMQGKLAQVVLNKKLETGNHQISLVRSNLKQGIYYIQLRSENESIVKKVLIE